MDGLCRHINLEGQYIYDYSFLDLDVFHKGFARARDGGWYHINTEGVDISAGERYAEIEPFYNGQALVRTITGEYLVLMKMETRFPHQFAPNLILTNIFNLKPFHIGTSSNPLRDFEWLGRW